MTTADTTGVVWMEKYRPTQLDDIIMDKYTHRICKNIVAMHRFPNLMLYGPPGTGKTTTAVNLIYEYQRTHETRVCKDRIIHLNASDDRGIDVVRSQIQLFAHSHCLFSVGMKFIILDEVDYMTKIAQQALKQLVQTCGQTVRFCLICNYISKIDTGLQCEFVRIRLNQLPVAKMRELLTHISIQENLHLSQTTIAGIMGMFQSDIRSMINFMQSNQHTNSLHMHIVNDDTMHQLFQQLTQSNSSGEFQCILSELCETGNVHKNNVLRDLVYYIIRRHPQYLDDSRFLAFVKIWVHSTLVNSEIMCMYVIEHLREVVC